jgi:hypothetical protein
MLRQLRVEEVANLLALVLRNINRSAPASRIDSKHGRGAGYRTPICCFAAHPGCLTASLAPLSPSPTGVVGRPTKVD